MTADIENYFASEIVRNDREIVVRALKPADESDMLTAFGRSSEQSRYLRFFGARRHFSAEEIDRFIHVDFTRHVALVATTLENGSPTIVGGARFVVTEPGCAEAAFTVIDQYQGQGIGNALFRHLVLIAQRLGLKEMVADVLSSNAPMLGLFRRSGLVERTVRDGDVVHVTLAL